MSISLDWTFVDSASVDFSPAMLSSSSSEQHKSVKKGTKCLAIPLWHKVVHGIPTTLKENLEAVEQSLTQLHPVTLLNSRHACCNDSLLLKLLMDRSIFIISMLVLICCTYQLDAHACCIHCSEYHPLCTLHQFP